MALGTTAPSWQIPLKISILFFVPFPQEMCLPKVLMTSISLCKRWTQMGFQYIPLSEANIVRHHTEAWCVSRPLVYSETVRLTVCPSDGSSFALHSFYLLTNINHQVRASTYQLFWRPLLANTDISFKILKTEFVKPSKSCPKEELWFLVNQNTALFSTFHPSSVKSVTSNIFLLYDVLDQTNLTFYESLSLWLPVAKRWSSYDDQQIIIFSYFSRFPFFPFLAFFSPVAPDIPVILINASPSSSFSETAQFTKSGIDLLSHVCKYVCFVQIPPSFEQNPKNSCFLFLS